MAEDEHPRTPEEEAELLGRLEEQIRRMSVSDHLAYMLESLAALATRKLGLGQETRAERDLDEARLAIDAFRALLQVAEPARPSQEVAAHRAMLSDLQLAYVKTMEALEEAPAASDAGEDVPSDCEAPGTVTGEDIAAGAEDGTLPLED